MTSQYSIARVRTYWTPYLCIVALVITANLLPVFGLDALLSDDQACYYNAGRGHFPWELHNRALLLPYLHVPILYCLHFSPELARFLLVLLFLVPSCGLFFHVLKDRFGVPLPVALCAAILPALLPAQELIPAFVDGSYCLYGLFFGLAALAVGLAALEPQRKTAWPLLAASTLLFFVASQVMEQSSFLFPPIALAFLSFSRLGVRSIALTLGFLLIACYRVYKTLTTPWGDVNTPHELSLTQVVARTRESIVLSTPLSSFFSQLYDWRQSVSSTTILLSLFAAVVIAGFALALIAPSRTGCRRPEGTWLSERQWILFVFGFAGLWFAANAGAFVTISKEFTSRYFLIASFGACTALALSLFLLAGIWHRRGYAIACVLLATLVIWTGSRRFTILKPWIDRVNQNQNLIADSLSRREFPEGTQIAVIGVVGHLGTDNWLTSSGYLQHTLGRGDVEGLLSVSPPSYFDPFNAFERGWHHRVRGLDLSRPIFLFKKDGAGLRQYEYALRWFTPHPQSPWHVLQFDLNSGTSQIVAKGTGVQEYRLFTRSQAEVSPDRARILWGEAPFVDEHAPVSGEPRPLKLLFGSEQPGSRIIAVEELAPALRLDHSALHLPVTFGNSFQLLDVLWSRGNDDTHRSLIFLWRSLQDQTIAGHAVGFEIRDAQGKTVWNRIQPFLGPGAVIDNGTTVAMLFRVPEKPWREARASGGRLIAYFLTRDPGDWSDYPKMLLPMEDGRFNVTVPFDPLPSD